MIYGKGVFLKKSISFKKEKVQINKQYFGSGSVSASWNGSGWQNSRENMKIYQNYKNIIFFINEIPFLFNTHETRIRIWRKRIHNTVNKIQYFCLGQFFFYCYVFYVFFHLTFCWNLAGQARIGIIDNLERKTWKNIYKK